LSSLINSSAPGVTSTDVNLKIPLKAVDAAAISTVHGEVVTSKETGAYVLKPFRSPKSKKLKTAVVFVPRLSHFDIENERSNKNEFRVHRHPCIRAMTLTIYAIKRIRDSSRSFGFRSLYGQSGRTFEA
jgi:hypothetical protein